ncbi:DUF6538 domain-containing protein [Pseudophaeobacter sp. C1-32P7]|uniref:DUF6538 domain-containing protein n=1 Tax=Pseudophaeobacter sp. C1-32P7 TaxID=3098142 RepID=UPI0034D54A6E
MTDSIKQRGKIWHLNWRVPSRYAEVESRKKLEFSLRTKDRDQAVEKAAVYKTAFRAQWETMLAAQVPSSERDAYDAVVAVAQSRELKYRPVQELVKDPLHEIMERLDSIQNQPPTSPVVTAALGGAPLPKTKVSEFPESMARLRADEIQGKTPDQLRQWKNKWLRAASAFVEKAGDRPMCEITIVEARKYQDHWKEIRDGGRTTDHVNKQIGHMEHMLDAYYEDLGITEYQNPFRGLHLKPSGREIKTATSRPKETPVVWIRDTLLNDKKMGGLKRQAHDIAIVTAETGTRANEVYNVPPPDIHLDHEIPYISIDMRLDGDNRREIKNLSSVRKVPLVGHALEAMRRNPTGFPDYRGGGSYSGYINKFIRKNNLLPDNGVTIRGLRHAFESRLRVAGVTNEERAMLMGHSLKKLRGREVYGDATELKIRALFLEMIAFPTKDWKPRSIAVLNAEIDRILEEEGFRLR